MATGGFITGGAPASGGIIITGGAPVTGGFIPAGGIIEPPFTGGFPGDPGGPTCERDPIAFFQFDDCSSDRTDLQDSSNQGHTAYRDVDQGCGDGRSGLAPIFDSREDLVYVPDQPDFVFSQGATVAAWIKPDDVRSTSTILRRRDGNSSAFALVLHRGRYEFIVRVGSRRFASVSVPAARGEWHHVAGTYDGQTVRMYLDGEEVDQTSAAGTLPEQSGPILMGNDMTGRRFEGLIDDVWLNTLAAPADKIMELTCVRQDPSLSVDPARAPAVSAGTPVTFNLSVTNNNSASCPAEQFGAGPNGLPPGFQSLSPDIGFFFGQVQEIASGETGVFAFDIASGEESEPGDYAIDFSAISLADFRFNPGIATAIYEVAAPTGCFVRSSRELMIRDLSVVDDPIRTSAFGPPGDSRSGAWTFQRLMERIAPTPAEAPDMAEAMLSSFLTPQAVNGFTIPSRPQMLDLVLGPWPRTANGKLDLAQAPMQLLAIVNRVDLKDLSKGSAGEGRIIFGVNDPGGFPMEFTVIFEYALPASDDNEARAWAEDFHALQALPFPSEEYNAALQAITDRFSARDVLPGTPSGSALIDIRTNEIALDFEWQFREFHLDGVTGALNPAPLFQTPDASFNFSPELGRFINQNAATILTERHDVPATFEGVPFQAASVFNNIDFWDAPGITDPDARHKFSLNTCNGCHGGETNTFFLHVSPRFPGQESQLSDFLLGTNAFDPVTGQTRRLAELRRRRLLMESVVCAP